MTTPAEYRALADRVEAGEIGAKIEHDVARCLGWRQQPAPLSLTGRRRTMGDAVDTSSEAVERLARTLGHPPHRHQQGLGGHRWPCPSRPAGRTRQTIVKIKHTEVFR